MKFQSTRSAAGVGKRYSFEEALFAGLCEDGGMFMPCELPQWSAEEVDGLRGKPFQDVAVAVLGRFLSDEIPAADLNRMVHAAFARFARPEEVVPVTRVPQGDGASVVGVAELWFGPTNSFKDLALSVMGQMLQYFLSRSAKRATVLVGTSGDTGSAVLHSVANLDAVSAVVLFPRGRTSRTQELQMTTISGPNVHVLACDGTSDDLDVPIKNVFVDQDFCRQHAVMSANSINVCRIVVQTVHFFYLYANSDARARKAPLTVCVPTGACGHITAGVMARLSGLHNLRIVAATNTNDIVHHLLHSGRMEVGPVTPTTSPSMDISVPYNVERLMWLLCGRDGAQVSTWMTTLEKLGTLQLSEEWWKQWPSALGLFSVSVPEDVVQKTIAEWWTRPGAQYALCPHSAVGAAAATRLSAAWRPDAETADESEVVVLATAHAAKFDVAMKAATGLSDAAFLEQMVVGGPGVVATKHLAGLAALPDQATALPRSADWAFAWTATVRSVIAGITASRSGVAANGAGAGAGAGAVVHGDGAGSSPSATA